MSGVKISALFVSVSFAAGAVACAASSPPPEAPRPFVATPSPPEQREVLPLVLGESGYFHRPGLDVMAFSDFYPEGHQGGVTIIQSDVRTAAGGDLRLEPAPGQWQPVPKLVERTVDRKRSTISARLAFPDESKDRKGFNPVEYPDLELSYTVRVEPVGPDFRVSVDLDEPLPEAWRGKVGFNLELFPGEYFGRTFHIGDGSGSFPRQVSGPLERDGDGRILSAPLGRGDVLSVAPESPRRHIVIEAEAGSELTLWDGRAEHNNGWFVVRGELSSDRTKGALVWVIRPSADPDFIREPVIHTSQVGYHTRARKQATLELDPADERAQTIRLFRIHPDASRTLVKESPPEPWGKFLRYDYRTFDFSEVSQEGVYRLEYGETTSSVFRISSEIYRRHVWQPTLEYFLPVQMCHVRVNDRYRVWHDHCHEDDARMAPTNLNHFDGYVQGETTLTRFTPGQSIDGLNRGGWHDAGDYDLRIESQIGTVRILSQIYEEFGLTYDATTFDTETQVVEMHRPDGIPDVLQQIEHGLSSILSAYDKLGRLYRGIIAPTNRQYVLLGDAAAQTDGRAMKGRGASPGHDIDDRWVFTEDNPARQLQVAAGLFAASRALLAHNAELSRRCLAVGRELLAGAEGARDADAVGMRIEALVELALTTKSAEDLKAVVDSRLAILANLEKHGWVVGRVLPLISDQGFKQTIQQRMATVAQTIRKAAGETPFGVPYTPNIWGAGWGIQKFGVDQYFLHQGFPDLFDVDPMLSALSFVLGHHPGENGASFVSGVGAKSLTVAYGVNRADWSYIPGGVGSGTALIQPDFPELKTWPFFWQQSEYVMGGGGTNFLFLALAAERHYDGTR